MPGLWCDFLNSSQNQLHIKESEIYNLQVTLQGLRQNIITHSRNFGY